MRKERRSGKSARRKRKLRRLDALLPEFEAKLSQAREQYANNWATGHAEQLNEEGHYEWMAGFLDGCPRIVEVGTGDGSGTIALCRRGAVVVSIEENPFCLQLAEQKLRAAGISVTVERRGVLVPDAEGGTFKIAYPRVSSQMPTEGALLLGGDLSDDPELMAWMLTQTPYDGIACWNIGSYRAMLDNTVAASDYRLILQNRVYEMAGDILKPGGLLHVVDRGRAPREENLQMMTEMELEGHREQTSVTSLCVDPNIQYRLYEPRPGNPGISLKAADTSFFPFDPTSMAFWSVVSRKT